MSLDLQAIRLALAGQLSEQIERGTTVYAYDPGDGGRSGRNITILPAGEYITFQTIGPNWEGDVMFDLRVEVPAAQLESAQIAMDDYLSAGVGKGSSIVDAISANQTLTGVVESCACTSVDGPDLTTDPLTAVLHVRVMASRGL